MRYLLLFSGLLFSNHLLVAQFSFAQDTFVVTGSIDDKLEQVYTITNNADETKSFYWTIVPERDTPAEWTYGLN